MEMLLKQNFVFLAQETLGSWTLSAVKSLKGHLFMEFVVQGAT